ncbi:sensor domain-containing protein [Phaeovulum vinaykumarii]|uniref:PAS domain S-box-containing protein/diguanylate cyclase (GGDEF) domain-containing protein n=1 Tax=Phaeovulum vinaykumarii TaxID=407234 RepID=A0A1N7LXB5_9RHOB|nr:PAS domain-containing protein [Phaeovulum vinaykumarii]SIS78444.1 PAS domain S-box-containing protein/diguanylate cyclase (GGDEF) domain-containing protein [Phaeovulum vinaykumarii]SOC07021.1 PAS domain S-box-containing protein/diguanylate cyclase (GGDEF)-like protein [Phaeovulum vinaykumarii]
MAVVRLGTRAVRSHAAPACSSTGSLGGFAVGTIETDLNGRIRAVSAPALSGTIGALLSRDGDPVGRSLFELIHDTSHDALRAWFTDRNARPGPAPPLCVDLRAGTDGGQRVLILGEVVAPPQDVPPPPDAPPPADAPPDALRLRLHLADLGPLLEEGVQLRADIERLSAIVEGADTGTWEWNVQTGETIFNDRWAAIVGYRLEELEPTSIDTWTALCHPDDLKRSEAELARHFAGETDWYDIEARMRHKDGRWVWVRAVGRLRSRLADGQPEWMCGLHRDIDQRKQGEARLARSEELMRRAGMLAGLGYWEYDVQTQEVFWSDETCRIHGCAPGHQIRIEDAIDFYAPDARETIRTAVERGLNDGTPWDLELPLRRLDGTTVWVRAVGEATREDGRTIRLSGALQDISERKETETRLIRMAAEADAARRDLEAREEMLRASTLSGEMAHWTVLPEQDEGWAPDETYRLMGYEPGDYPATRQGWRTLLHPEDCPMSVGAIDRLIAGETQMVQIDQRMRHKDGSYHWYRCIARLIDDPGRPVRVSGVLINIDHMKDSERRLAETAQEARRARDRLNTLADNTPGALFEHREHPDGRVDLPYFSAKLPDLLGVSAEDMQADGAAAARNIHPDDQAEIAARIAHTRETGEPLICRYRLNHPVKGLRWMMLSSLPMRMPDGATIWCGNVMDVTEQTEADRRLSNTLAELRTSHARLDAVVENIPGALFDYRRGPDGTRRFEFFSSKMPTLLGVSAEDLRKTPEDFMRNIPEEEQAAIRAVFETSMRDLSIIDFDHALDHPEKGRRRIHVWANPQRDDDGTTIWLGKVLDITEQVATEKRADAAVTELHRAHAQLASIADIAPVGLYEFRRQPSGAADFPYTSARFNELVGFSREEIVELQDRILERVDRDDWPTFADATAASARDLSPWRMRFRFHHATRGLLWLSGASTPRREADGSVVWTGALHDVTLDVLREAELAQAHRLADRMRAQNEHLAFHDGLTGLPNRRYFDQMLRERLQEVAAGRARQCTLIQIDLDHFKQVNDTLGHQAGDIVLRRVAEILRENIREADFAARVGGDEFSVILEPATTEDQARGVIERIRARLAEPFSHEDLVIRCSASFGIASTENSSRRATDLLQLADAALYRAKQGGRNRIEFYSLKLERELQGKRRLAEDVRSALENNEIEPFFQPQVSAKDGTLVGIEVLARWNHPTRGLIGPDAFMRVAEQLHLVPEIDHAMILRTRLLMQRLDAEGVLLPKVSFNVCSGSMHDPGIIRSACELSEAGYSIAFEIVENVLVEEEDAVFWHHLDMLKSAGIGIEIDDFGSGHTSIIGLMEIAPSTLKIDGRIIRPIAREARARNLTRTIIDLAGGLGIHTIAEGVETAGQAATLRSLGCDALQGYLYAHPMSAADLTRFLTSGGRLPAAEPGDTAGTKHAGGGAKTRGRRGARAAGMAPNGNATNGNAKNGDARDAASAVAGGEGGPDTGSAPPPATDKGRTPDAC